ncbi:MAG TPA: STAS domain-containing protein [Sedimentisphaerales bacterium]|nr:STAS domain-containing protein [Sedimentisphaerales bacterium]
MNEKDPLEITTDKDVTVITFNVTSISGLEGLETVSKLISDFVSANYPRKILFDFQRVKFFSSQTLGLLLDVWKRARAYQGCVAISGINPQLHRVFRITNLDRIFPFYPDRQSALREMA